MCPFPFSFCTLIPADDVAKPYVRKVLKQRLQEEFPDACEDEAAVDAALDDPPEGTEGLLDMFFKKKRSQEGNKSTTVVSSCLGTCTQGKLQQDRGQPFAEGRHEQ
jgi:hypothetical protein